MSVQGLIFCEKPYYNEPGREMHSNEGDSQQYNCLVRTRTIRLAILPCVRAIAQDEGSCVIDEPPRSKELQYLCPDASYHSNARKIAPYWRDIVRLYLHTYAGDLLKNSAEAVKTMPQDFACLGETINVARRVFKTHGYI